VSSEGSTSSAAAACGGISRPSRPIATVGNPMPVTPLTSPAAIKINRKEIVCKSNIMAHFSG